MSVQANLQEPPKGDMAIGNIVGSNICNIALILGIASLIRPIRINLQLVKREMPLLLAFTGVFVVFLLDGTITRWEGGILFSGIILYVWSSIRLARREPQTPALEGLEAEEVREIMDAGKLRVILDLILILVGLVLLLGGADRLVAGGSNIALRIGVSEAFIGLTVLAFGTSLPELATTVVAAARKQGDFITGNAVGSCIFNILCVVGLASLVAPLSRTANLQNADLGFMMALTIVIFPFVWSRRRLARWEGAILTASYLGYFVYLLARGA